MLAVAILCASAMAQENTAESWYKKGRDLGRNGSYEEAVFAYNRAIELEPNNATFYTALVPNLNMLAFTTNNQSRRNESLEAIDKALEIDPKNPIAWEQKGSMLYYQTKRYHESLEAYDKAIENISSYSPDNQLNQTEFLSYTWTSKSISLWQLIRYNESLEAVDKAVQIDPAGNYDAWAFKGELLASLGRYNESLQAFEGAAATETARSQPEIKSLPWAAEGYVLMQMGRYEEADRIYQKIIGLNFTSEGSERRLANAWRGRGNALAKLGRYNESIRAFDRAIELNAEIAPYAWTGKGYAMLASGRYDEAVKAYDQALELYPEYADAGIAQKGRGDALARLGKRNDALVAYRAAVEASDRAISAFNNATPLDRAVSFTFDPYPLDGEFWHNRAFALHALGREAEAEESSAKAIEMGYRPEMVEAVAGSGPCVAERTECSPETAYYWIDKGNALAEQANCDEAIKALDNATELSPQDKHIWMSRGLILASHLGRYNDSIEAYERAIQIDPGDADAWFGKGAALNKAGRYEEAIKCLEMATELDPKSAAAWKAKGDAQKAMGQVVNASMSFLVADKLGYQE